MQIIINCERMAVWDFDHCIDCRRFKARHSKGLNNWGCSLNNATAKERSDFGMVWAAAWLRDRGIKIQVPEVIIVPVKSKRK